MCYLFNVINVNKGAYYYIIIRNITSSFSYPMMRKDFPKTYYEISLGILLCVTDVYIFRTCYFLTSYDI